MSTSPAAGMLLWRIRLQPGAVPDAAAAAPGLRLVRVAFNREQALLYVYGEPDSVDDREGAIAVTGATALDMELSRLERVMELPGRSHAEPARCHYVVETDAEAGWEDEIERWYAQEHLPGLANVPGCVRAQRYINLDAGPRSFACYDLVAPDVVGSAPWLAVRGTEWSSRARPHFTNTRRTFFELLRAP